MADVSGSSNGGSQEEPNGSTPSKTSLPLITISSPNCNASGVSDAGVKEAASNDSVAEESPTTYRRSVSEGSLHDVVEMPYLEAPPNSPVLEKEDDNELEYKEPDDNVSNTINRILEVFADRPETDIEPPFRNPSKSQIKMRREGMYNGFSAAHFGSVSGPPLGLPQSPPSASRGHRRSKSIRDFGFGSSKNNATASDLQHLLNDDSRASLGGSSYEDVFMNACNTSYYLGGRDSATLRPARGRDVSFAMRHVGLVSEASQATIVTEDEDSPLRHQATRLPSTSAYGDLRSQRDHGINQNPNIPEQDEGLVMRDSANTDDWCTTEMNSEAGFVSGTSMNHPNIIQPTGSSVAGNSEESVWRMPTTVRYRPRVIQHPGLKGQQESYEMHTMKPSKWPVLLPKGQHSRPGGYPENSSRCFTVGESNEHPTSPMRNVSSTNPFLRIDSNRRNMDSGSLILPTSYTGRSRFEFRDSVSTFATQTLERHPSNARLSMAPTESGDGVLEKVPLRENLPVVKSESDDSLAEQTSSKVVEVSSQKPSDPCLVDQDYPNRRMASRKISKDKDPNWVDLEPSTSNAELMSSRSKFEFELIPLDEAQRLNKEQRDCGETDETESTIKRCLRAENVKSIRAVSNTPARIPHPLRKHTRRIEDAPKLSIDFSPSSVFYTDALRDITPPFSATTHPNLAEPAKARVRTPSVTEDTILTPLGAPSWIERMKTHAVDKKNSVQRKISNMTVIHHVGMDNDSQMSLAAIEDMTEPYLSYGARVKRQRIFAAAACVSALFPFIAILVMAGILDPVLLWYTSGEARRLTIRQHNIVRNMFLAWCCVLMILLPTIIAVYVKRS
ncbi:uncharacterized protein GGS22DRAFT_196440 [Annulohypoxylon maeteangense]|uniref:uncharacterized protein n=1 Tax=Annulohypoxylon maeteangense TaxID=1927788 RepID=UPI0020079E62|nr:uncharacterized protein GGS22DRAFT_196440 [Annulohypoxylon maeteangense]KAI0881491.1 hypothetical protein GGS22DRAFT_196440 [Annulohypoxylon maeteangense]